MITVGIVVILVCLTGWAVKKIMQKSQNGGGCCGTHEGAVKRISALDRKKGNYPYRVELSIGGMTCDNCAARVENALNALPDTWAKVDIGENKAEVLLKSKPDETTLREAVRKAGYVVMNINTNSIPG